MKSHRESEVSGPSRGIELINTLGTGIYTHDDETVFPTPLGE